MLLQLESREREATGIANLRVEYNRVHGFFIEVSKGQIDKYLLNTDAVRP
ncbi:hypothetical protein [Oligella ureolytica]